MPVGLRSLQVYPNSLETLPELAHCRWLQELQVGENMLAVLPALPCALERLGASRNLLLALPALPSTLKYLEVRGNELSGPLQLEGCSPQLECLYP